MTGNIYGENFVLVSFGESHGSCVGAVVDGCPAGLRISEEDVQKELDLRRPGTSIVTTQRREEDRVEVLSGVFGGFTTGAPVAMLIRNADKDPKAYLEIQDKPRPGHADYTARVKYGGFNDWRGGGRFSGRITATFVMGGAIAKKLLMDALGVEILAFTREIGGTRVGDPTIEEIRRNRYSNEVRCPDPEVAERMKKEIIGIRGAGDSLGGVVECVALNLPVGVGEPVFSSLDSDLARMMLSIPAAKGVDFGSGFAAAGMKGSENNDPFFYEGGKVVTHTNNSGGILGGLTNGMPLRFRVVFKPTSSIASLQRTVSMSKKVDTEFRVPGRHDPTVVPRAVPVVENAAALVLADLAIRGGFIPPVLEGGR
ncbi:MAG: chorismate synthase [Nitrososphaerota archaeon]|nr:chorismate synthase [Nitrososphaerota archaeon]MDG6938826.1 chorismate synthase [Nitrososphaerota archaeon]